MHDRLTAYKNQVKDFKYVGKFVHTGTQISRSISRAQRLQMHCQWWPVEDMMSHTQERVGIGSSSLTVIRGPGQKAKGQGRKVT